MDTTAKQPPIQNAKPFFALFNASNYWLQAALVIGLFLVLHMMPFMKEAAHAAGGNRCPTLMGMFKDAFVRSNKVHDICNQTPSCFADESDEDEDEDEECDEEEVEEDIRVVRRRRPNTQQRRVIRQAKPIECPISTRPIDCTQEDGSKARKPCCLMDPPPANCCTPPESRKRRPAYRR